MITQKGENDLLERKAILAAIEAEDELPGKPPDEMIGQMIIAMKSGDIDFFIEVMRVVVRETKKGIHTRICTLRGKESPK